MNGYQLSRLYWDWAFANPEQCSPALAALYHFAIEHCNRLGWKTKFGLPATMAMEAIGIRSYSTYSKVFNKMVEIGGFELIQRSKNQYSSNIIALSKFDKAPVKALDKAMIKHSSKHCSSTYQSTWSIDKPRTINQEQQTTNSAGGENLEIIGDPIFSKKNGKVHQAENSQRAAINAMNDVWGTTYSTPAVNTRLGHLLRDLHERFGTETIRAVAQFKLDQTQQERADGQPVYRREWLSPDTFCDHFEKYHEHLKSEIRDKAKQPKQSKYKFAI